MSLVAVKDIDLPQDMQRAMAKQAEAERERRAKVIHAEGSFKPRKNYPTRRRFWPNSRHLFTSASLQALSQVAIEKNHTIIVPVPLDLLASFQR